jgi:hypothetical protein
MFWWLPLTAVLLAACAGPAPMNCPLLEKYESPHSDCMTCTIPTPGYVPQFPYQQGQVILTPAPMQIMPLQCNTCYCDAKGICNCTALGCLPAPAITLTH